MKVGVIGAGNMGSGIAQAFVQNGFDVALCDIKAEWAAGGKEKIRKNLGKLVAKGKLEQAAVDGMLDKIVRERTSVNAFSRHFTLGE